MKKSILCTTATLLLTACGSQYSATYHFIPSNILQAQNKKALGYSTREWNNYEWKCDIYLAPPENYSSALCFTEAVEHEKKHCREGNDLPANEEVNEKCWLIK